MGEIIDLDLAQAAAWLAVCFAVCEVGAVIVAVTLAWLVADGLKR